MTVCTAMRRGRLSGGVYPEPHAIERYQEHFPVATIGDIRLAIGLGLLLENRTAAFLLGRSGKRVNQDDRYVLLLHGRGLFILTQRTAGTWAVVTYARFEESQVSFVREHWLDCRDEAVDVPMEAA